MEEAEQAAASLKEEGLTAVSPIKLDITNSADRVAVSQLIARRFGHLDILVSNAGIGTPEGTGTVGDALTIGTSPEELRQVFETNVFAALLLTRELLPLLQKSSGARIVKRFQPSWFVDATRAKRSGRRLQHALRLQRLKGCPESFYDSTCPGT